MADKGNDLIFISIASYRDAQLIPTILSCLTKAADPERLRFGICWQHGPEEDSIPVEGDKRFEVIDVDWRDSKGVCWARSGIMKLWSGEDWYLQIDSHCRFASRWDETLIEAAMKTDSPKPILSTYPPAFIPAQEEFLSGDPTLMAFLDFTPDGIPSMKSLVIPNWRDRDRPMRARFLAAGFLFAPGSFVEDVPYDPELYFMGEEATMTVRAFTSGYDLFHPCDVVIWHDYLRADARRHWDDHTEENNVIRQWGELDLKSREKVKRVYWGLSVEDHALGTVRSLEEYEAYAGLSFSLRKCQNYTVRSQEPPNPKADPRWTEEIFTWMVRISIAASELPEGSLDGPSFWCVCIYDAENIEIYRRDVQPSELATLPRTDPKLSMICEFRSGFIPAVWSVWPVSRSRGWLTKMTGLLSEDDYSIIVDGDEEDLA